MNIVKTFQADGYLPAGLVLNARLNTTKQQCVVPQLSPLEQSGLTSNLALAVDQANDQTMIRLKGKVSGAAVLGSLEGHVLTTPEFIDLRNIQAATVRNIDPIHDPCVLLTPMRFAGTIVITTGTDSPIAALEVNTDWSVTISKPVHHEWRPTIGAVSIPAVLYMGSGLTRSLYSATQSSLSALYTQRGVEVTKASDDWLAIAPQVEEDIKAVAAMTEIPNLPKVPNLRKITFESGGEMGTAFISCVTLTVSETIQAQLEQADLTEAALIADPAASMMPFTILPSYRLVDVYSELGLAGLFTPESGEWFGLPMAKESVETTFSV